MSNQVSSCLSLADLLIKSAWQLLPFSCAIISAADLLCLRKYTLERWLRRRISRFQACHYAGLSALYQHQMLFALVQIQKWWCHTKIWSKRNKNNNDGQNGQLSTCLKGCIKLCTTTNQRLCVITEPFVDLAVIYNTGGLARKEPAT